MVWVRAGSACGCLVVQDDLALPSLGSVLPCPSFALSLHRSLKLPTPTTTPLWQD